MSAPVIDGTSTAYGGNTELNSTPTFSFTVSSNPNRYLKVDVALGYNSAATCDGVTWNGTTVPLVKDSGFSPNAQARVYTFGLVAPESGTHNIIATLGTLNNGERVTVTATVYKDVDQTTPIGTPVSAVFDSTTPTVDVSSATGETVVDAIAMKGATTPTVGAGQTSRYIQANPDGEGYGAGSEEAGASTVTMSWGGGENYDSSIVAYALKPVSAAATLDQEGFRWYADDGSESGSTALAAQDTGLTQAAGTVGRLRMLVNATGDPATKQYKLQYKISTDSDWSDIA